MTTRENLKLSNTSPPHTLRHSSFTLSNTSTHSIILLPPSRKLTLLPHTLDDNHGMSGNYHNATVTLLNDKAEEIYNDRCFVPVSLFF